MEAQGLPEIGPERFAALVATASDEQIAEGMQANRRLILDEIFRQMPAALRADRTADADFVIEWRITGGPDGGEDRYQLTIRAGACSVEREGSAQPDVVYTIGPVDFVRLVAGHAEGPALFLFGKLKVRGNLFLAARMPGFFRIPSAPGG